MLTTTSLPSLVMTRTSVHFVSLLITSLVSAGYTVHQAPDDADTFIVKVALQLATGSKVVSVIANVTDILIMLDVHYRPHVRYLHVHRIWSVCHFCSCSRKRLGAAVISQLLVIHAISESPVLEIGDTFASSL